MDRQISLSYVLTTFNKLDYLKITLPLLISACLPDEEIVVVDGGSDDGTVDFVSGLFKRGLVHQFLSEKDFGEAHGTNKAMLLARGTLIKIITDDDIFSFTEIGKCKKFMIGNVTVDVLGFDGFGINLSGATRQPSVTRFIEGFRKWKSTREPFLFCGLSLMIRKSSISYLGLFNPSFTIVDMEYSMRISSLKANIAFYTGLAFVNIVGPASNSIKFYSRIEEERKRVNKIYRKGFDSHFSSAFGSALYVLGKFTQRLKKKKLPLSSDDYAEVAAQSIVLMSKYNAGHPSEFLTANQ